MTEITALDPARVAPDVENPPVAQVMRQEVVFCLPSTPADAVAKLLADNEISELPVLIDRRPVGYVTSRDIVAQLVEGNVGLGGSDTVRPFVVDLLARDILRTPPLLVDENAQLWEVLAVMRQQQRQTAVVMHEDELPVGMLTPREIALHIERRIAAGAEPRG